MPLELFLNELSVPAENAEIHAACEHFKRIVQVVQAVRRKRAQVVLNSDVPISALRIAGYEVGQIRNSSLCVEEGQFLKRLQDRSPFAKSLSELGNAGLREYRIVVESPVCSGEIAAGLGWAHCFDGLSISFASHSYWQEVSVPLELEELDVDGELVVRRVTARNVARSEDVNGLEFQEDDDLPVVRDGAELWARREELLPHLRFIPRVRAQIENLPFGDRSFRSVLRKLLALEEGARKWREDNLPVPQWAFSVRPESASRVNEGLVDFQDGNGSTRTFSDHTDFGPIEGRIHFVLEGESSRHVLVGHVGRKLGIG